MDFFKYYKEFKSISFPFQTFHWMHFLALSIIFLLIWILLRRYRSYDKAQKRKFQIYMAVYFFIEEALYTLWLLWRCHEKVWLEIMPLQLCSLCVYVAIAAVYFDRKELRFFSGIVGTLAGLVAIVYPANISLLYPAFSYRTINFFMLHGAFVLFGCIQLQDHSLLQYGNIKRCTCLLGVMVAVAFSANLTWHTDYMFIGVPPTIGFIRMLYQATGLFLFLPVIILLLVLLQYIAVFVFRRLCHCTKAQVTARL